MVIQVLKLLFIYSLTLLSANQSEIKLRDCCEDSSEESSEVDLRLHVYLEGAYSAPDGVMHNKLNKLGYLPGQKPKTFFSKKTTPGQPYKNDPWKYEGNQGVVKKNEIYDYDKDVVDWLLVSIRENEHRSSTIYRAPAHLYKDGTVKIINAKKCVINSNKTYFVVIEHRNHLSVMSSSQVKLEDGVIQYDFRSQEAYLEGQKEIGDGLFAMIAGNANVTKDEITMVSIDEEDIKSWEGGNGLNSSYFIQDVDLSGDVSIKDKEILFKNLGLFSTVPQ